MNMQQALNVANELKAIMSEITLTLNDIERFDGIEMQGRRRIKEHGEDAWSEILEPILLSPTDDERYCIEVKFSVTAIFTGWPKEGVIAYSVIDLESLSPSLKAVKLPPMTLADVPNFSRYVCDAMKSILAGAKFQVNFTLTNEELAKEISKCTSINEISFRDLGQLTAHSPDYHMPLNISPGENEFEHLFESGTLTKIIAASQTSEGIFYFA